MARGSRLTTPTNPPGVVTENDNGSQEVTSYGKFEVKSAAEAVTWGYCILLFSRAGSGKTTLAGGAADDPADGPVLFIDAEGGTKVISHRPEVEVITVHSWDEIKELTSLLKRDTNLRWKTIVLDNLSEYVQLVTTKVVGGVAQPSWPEWGEVAREIVQLVRDYRDLARTRGINSIIIAWDSAEEDKAKRPLLTIAATPKIQGDLPGIVDIIGHIDPIDGQPDKRLLNFEPSSRTIQKFRRVPSETGKTIPNKIIYSVDNLPMADILRALKRGVPFPVEKYAVAPAQAGRR
jgi:hypothetical protein